MKLLKEYFDIQKQVFAYFGYMEDWVTIPLSDETNMQWYLKEDGHGGGDVYYHENLNLENAGGNFYSGHIYTQRFLPKWIYRGKDYTMISVDTQTDGNKFLMVFDNAKEVKDKEVIQALLEY